MKMATPTNTIKIGIVQRPKAKKAKKKYHRFLTDSLIIIIYIFKDYLNHSGFFKLNKPRRIRSMANTPNR